jgi:hypothetical protein
MIQFQVQKAVDDVCPNDGVSFPDIDDKTTWRVSFKSESTAQQRTNAQAAIDAFIYVAPDPANLDLTEKALKALALVMREYCNQLQAGTYTNKTVNQLKADFKSKFDALI